MKVKIRKKVDELFALPPKPGKRKEIEETFPYAGQPYGGSRLQDPEAEHCGHVKRAKAQGRREVMDEIIDEEVEAVLEERCQKGYKTHPTRKTKKMYGKTGADLVIEVPIGTLIYDLEGHLLVDLNKKNQEIVI